MKYVLVMFLFLFSGVVFAQDISLADYQKNLNLLEEYKSKINWTKADKIAAFFDKKCDYYKEWAYYYVLPWCFETGKLPKLSLKQTVNLVWPLIKKFDKTYDLNSKWFFYKPTKIDYFVKYDLSDIIWTWNIAKLWLWVLSITHTWIKIPEIYLAFNQIKNYSFYVAWKDLSKRNWWRLQNFDVAFKALDNLVLQPNQIVFLNKLLANLPWYYTKGSDRKYLFYAGVCWVSTMFFRLALINPYLYVVKRYNHFHRYVYFYSNYLYGDDAAIYQYDKVLKIKNIYNKPILFKTKKIKDKLYFVSIVPSKVDKFVYVEKRQIWRLKALVKKVVFNADWGIDYIQQWISKYLAYSYER